MYLLMFFCFDGSDSKNSLLKRRQRNLTPTLRKVKHCSIFCISSIRNFKAKQTYCYLWFFILTPKNQHHLNACIRNCPGIFNATCLRTKP